MNIVLRIGYCWAELVTMCSSPESIEKAQVTWLETGIVEEIEIGTELIIKGKGYYKIEVTKK